MAKRLAWMTAIVTTWLLAAPPAGIAGPLEDGASAFARKDYTAALDLWRPLAEHGDAAAENNLARMYDEGRGVAVDRDVALRWRTQAAEHGNLEAIKSLIGSSRNDADWRHWVEIAAAKGDAESQLMRGESFLMGRHGNLKDVARAIPLLEAAANNGNIAAADRLGLIYGVGFGLPAATARAVPENPKLAAFWYQKAADRGDPRALTVLGQMYGYGQGVPKDKARALALFQQFVAKNDNYRILGNQLIAQLEQANALPSPPPGNFDTVRTRAERGDAAAQTELGRMYRKENSSIKDDVAAFKWLQAAASQGNPDAEGDLYDMYRSGRGVKMDPAEAMKWLRKAAGDGHSDSQLILSGFYFYGQNGLPVDAEQSLIWLKKSAESGYPAAEVEFARRLSDGLRMPRDRDEAMSWYQKGALHGSYEAQMVMCVYTWPGPKSDRQKFEDALRWCRMAAAHENPAPGTAKTYVDKLEAGIARQPN